MKTIIWCCISTFLFGCTMPDKQCRNYYNPAFNTSECTAQRKTEAEYGWTEYLWKVPVYTVGGIFILGAALAGGGSSGNTIQQNQRENQRDWDHQYENTVNNR